jgi:hypothetical protein
MPPRKTNNPTNKPPKLEAEPPPTEADAQADPNLKPKATKKAKAASTPPASRAFAALALSEPWMRAWAELSLNAGGTEAACKKVEVSLADFADARRRDPGFDDLCRTLDQIVDLRIMEKLRTEAIQGDARAQALYYARVRELVLPPVDDPVDDTPLPPSVAEAMISAGLAAAAALAEAAPPKTSRPRDGGHEDGL